MSVTAVLPRERVIDGRCLTGALHVRHFAWPPGVKALDPLPVLLEVPGDQYVTAVVSLGYPAETPNAPKRKPLEEKVRYV